MNVTYSIPSVSCKYFNVSLTGNNGCHYAQITALRIGGYSNVTPINQLPTIEGISNNYVIFPNDLQGNILASDPEHDSIAYSYVCDVSSQTQSQSVATTFSAQLGASKIISDYNNPSQGAFACPGHSCGLTQFLSGTCGLYGQQPYTQCPVSDEFRTTSYVTAYEDNQPFYSIRVNANDSFMWILPNNDASKELSWRAYPGFDPRPFTYTFILWDSSFLVSQVYRWFYNVSNGEYTLIKTLFDSAGGNTTQNITIGSFNINDFAMQPYPDLRFILDYNYQSNITFSVQDTTTNEKVIVGTDNLSINAFNQTMTSSNYRFLFVQFMPAWRGSAFYAFKQSPIFPVIQWSSVNNYVCSYSSSGTRTLRAYVTDSVHQNSSYVYADFIVTSTYVVPTMLNNIVARFVDISDSIVVQKFLFIYQVFLIALIGVIALIGYYALREFIPEISAWVYVAVYTILLYGASLVGLLLPWTGVLMSVFFSVLIAGFIVRHTSGGSTGTSNLLWGVLFYFAFIFLFVGLLGQVSGSYQTFGSVELPQSIVSSLNQTDAPTGGWQTISNLGTQILSIIYIVFAYLGRILAIITFSVINIPLWLTIIMNAFNLGFIVWGLAYLRGHA